MSLLDRLEASYTVQEQEAAEHIRVLYNTLDTIKKIIEADLFGVNNSIIEVINMVHKNGSN